MPHQVVLSEHAGARVVCFDNYTVTKSGRRVRPNEETAMRLVAEHTKVPVPEIFGSSYGPGGGSISMSLMPGVPLDSMWDRLDEAGKERLCREIWWMIAKWQQIARPPDLAHVYQCLADGSAATTDPLLQDMRDPPRPLFTDDEVRARIYERYWYHDHDHHGQEDDDESTLDTLLVTLPHSDNSVFTHGEMAPRNIMVDRSSGRVSGVVDWELAGWYPDYWEYANIMRAPSTDLDWQRCMDRTAPRRWDLEGIKAARRVLF
ncbi:hypothetical protein MMC07_006031 [Pseudocyphellaria aurata]|nr:hypothetical protein [Pseudocyphellaria aurata]